MPTQIAVITGAGAGIGRAAARALGRAGFDIALLGRNEDRLKDAAPGMAAHSIRTLVTPAAVPQPEAAEQAACQAEA